MSKWIEGKPADGTYYYLPGRANITQLDDGRWRWECHSSSYFLLEMDGWWGICSDKEKAMIESEEWLKKHGVDL